MEDNKADFSMLDAVPLGIFVLDADYRVLFWNNMLEEWTNIVREKIVGSQIADFFPHFIQPRFVSRLRGVFEGGPPVIFSAQLHKYVIPIEQIDGSFSVQHTTVRAIRGTDEGVYHALVSIQDVTDLTGRIRRNREMRDEAIREVNERKIIEAELERSQARYKALSELTSDFAFSMKVEANGQLTVEWVTDAFFMITGYRHEDFVSLSDWQQMIHPDDINENRKVFNTLMLGHADSGLQHRIITKDGRTRYVQTYLRPVVDEQQGDVIQIVGAVQDITQRLETEIRLRESEERFRQIAENIDSVIYICNWKNDQVLYVNPAYERIIGQSRDMLTDDSKAYVTLIHPDDRETILTHLTNQDTIPSFDITYRLMRPDNYIYWIRQRCIPIHRDSRTLSDRYICVMEDVTEQRLSAERDLELALEREQIDFISSFITDASHEFRTPLAIINSSVYLLKRVEDGEKRDHHLKLVGDQVETISQLVNRLVFMAGLERHNNNVVEKVELPTLLNMIVDLKRDDMQAKNIILSLDLPDTPTHVRARPTYLWQAIASIIENAIKYTPEDGTITLRVKHADSNAVIEVEDTGIGMSDEVLANIFKRFYRADEAHSTRGLGLGLSIAQKIIAQHNGTITVRSQIDEGTTFSVELPTYVEP